MTQELNALAGEKSAYFRKLTDLCDKIHEFKRMQD
jgi:hypothetical protein